MASGFRIMCANKNQQGFIIRVAGSGWTLTAHEAIVKLNNQQLRFNVRVDGKDIDVGVRGEGFDAYLVLEPDGFPLHNLTDLPSC